MCGREKLHERRPLSRRVRQHSALRAAGAATNTVREFTVIIIGLFNLDNSGGEILLIKHTNEMHAFAHVDFALIPMVIQCGCRWAYFFKNILIFIPCNYI